ncbi:MULTISPECIES: glycosyltransferase [unclassified Leptolyngbya]|uniref:glycosyltransferase n=1 Tax=unclassified Leptolyngbya TaxID=2650499 RepID=UPI001685A0F1|nr:MULTISPECIES: glycosyltransferase [unclassified Leptolyngbya]MBD1911949.1 glycosyltransferase [Leptolyngbya sp. FACHB-8]MBD2154250.1 glycosyltransferase [Leptolyngbya sp. FACHB-16]
MNILFLHNNFPAQYRELAKALARDPNNRVVYGTKHTEDVQLPGVIKVNYAPSRDPHASTHHYVRSYESAVLHGQAVFRLADQLKKSDFVPDVVCSHAGWGNGIFIKDAFPDTALLSYFEWFGHAKGTDADFDPAFPLDMDDHLRIRAGNATLLVDLYSCDRGISPTHWQKSQLPPEFQSKIDVLHDGIDTDYFFPDPNQKMCFPEIGLDLSDVDEIVTYVSRGMDAYRGFPQFIEAIALLLERRPNCHVVIVAGDRIAYGPAAPKGNSFKEVMLERFPLDMNRVHFLGTLPYGIYKLILRASSVHVYLTRPFVLSWSFMESLSSGCLVVASDTPPVREMAQDGVNALLVDFFDTKGICDRLEYALTHQDELKPLRENARKTIVDNYALSDLLPKHVSLIQTLMRR